MSDAQMDPQFLRPAFSVYPDAIPEDARIRPSGYGAVTTMGWYRRSETYGYTIIPITIAAVMMYVAIAVTLWHVLTERGSFTTFDTPHVVMVSSTRDVTGSGKDHLKDCLAGFEKGEVASNESLRVQLTDVGYCHKRFEVTND